MNILIVDEFGEAGRRITDPDNEEDTHGYNVLMSALEIAPRATYSAVESGVGRLNYRQGGVQGGGTRTTRFGVINWSFGLEDPSTLDPLTGRPLASLVLAEQQESEFLDLLGGSHLTNSQDAVITFSAGNNGDDAAKRDAGHYADAVALVTHSSTGPRVLIVGALNRYARTANPQSFGTISTRARIASYSNRAGANPAMQERFLLEYGGSPYREAVRLCDAGTPASTGCANQQDLQDASSSIAGTSFAAPRVAGFAALLRDKFPRLSGAQTANLLLETATTQGLACHTGAARKSPSCAKNIYGQGRVDIGNALAPVGSVR